MNPKISIITVSFNCVNSIEETILSVLNQTYKNFEYIIIDGGSNDGTVDIIKKYDQYITKWISEKDEGTYYAMNKGINLATGDYINFMNSGDLFFDENVLQNVKDNLKTIDVLYGDNLLCYDWGQIRLAPDNLENTKKYMVFGHQTVFIKRNVISTLMFDCKFKIAADYNLFYKLFTYQNTFRYLPICISKFSAIEGLSSNNPLITFKEDAKINGEFYTIKWKIKYVYFILRIIIRSIIINILPKEVVNKIKMKNTLRNKLIKEVNFN